MARAWASWTLALFLLTATVLAGCFGGDELDPEEKAIPEETEPGEGVGVIEGRVFTVDLEVVTDARVSLVDEGALVREARSDGEGGFVLDGLEPGAYRLQVTATCCREHVQAVEVAAGETVRADVKLTPFTADDLQEGYVQEFEWTGFLACGVTLVIYASDVCEDVNEDSDTNHVFELAPGIASVTAVLVWDAPGVTGDELNFGLAQEPCEDPDLCVVPSDFYGYETGGSPLYLRIDGGEPRSFQGITEPATVKLSVFPSFWTVDVFYNMEFTVYYQLHYHDLAPEDYDPLPDQ